MKAIPVHECHEWPYVLTLLPDDIEESAHRAGALVRCRNIPDAKSLLRVTLAYALTDLSLKDVAAWAKATDVASITGPGLFYRLREAENWLQELLAKTLQSAVDSVPLSVGPLRVVDATVVNGPGGRSTDWRVHAVADPCSGTFCSVEITDETGAENYQRHAFRTGEVVLGDRMYAMARGVHAVTSVGAEVVARLNPHSVRVCNRAKEVIPLLNARADIPKMGVADIEIVIPIPPERKTRSHKTWKLTKAIAWVPARVVAARSRKGNITWVLTTLPRAKASGLAVMDLYRVRWQVELFFKRLKSLLDFDSLPSRRGPTAKSWMLARLLAAALAQKLVVPTGAISPWGYDLRKVRPQDERLVTLPHEPVGASVRDPR